MSIIFALGLLFSIILLLLSGWLRLLTPTLSFDDIAYRAASPMQWIQAQSIFRSASISEHGNIFLYGTGILYMWPFLFNLSEATANILYWMAFPIILLELYLFSELVTKNRFHRLIAILLYISAPIIFRNFTSVLIHETWMGIVLVSGVYSMYYILKHNETSYGPYFFTGVIFGILPQLKPTGWFYTLLLFLFFKKQYRKYFLTIIVGFMTSILISGYAIILFQNFQLYGSPGGSTDFRTIHTASYSITQVVTHLIRLPFLLIKYPCYTDSCTGFDPLFQPLADTFGATRILSQETTTWWIGTFTYISSDPDRNFGFGGILWFLLFILTAYDAYKVLMKKKTLSLERQLFLLFSCIILFLILVTRWEDASGVPYKHLIGAFAIPCIFSYRIFEGIKKRPLLNNLLIIDIVFCTYPLLLQTTTAIHFWYTQNKESALQTMRLGKNPYEPFLETVTRPSTMVTIETAGIPYYGLFLLQGKRMNTVYVYRPTELESLDTQYQIIKRYINNKQIDYILISTDSPNLQLISTLFHFTPYMTVPFENATIQIFRNTKK